VSPAPVPPRFFNSGPDQSFVPSRLLLSASSSQPLAISLPPGTPSARKRNNCPEMGFLSAPSVVSAWRSSSGSGFFSFSFPAFFFWFEKTPLRDSAAEVLRFRAGERPLGSPIRRPTVLDAFFFYFAERSTPRPKLRFFYHEVCLSLPFP